MKLITKEVSNPEKKFWIWNEKITNKQDGRIYPHNTTNVGSGKSVAVYQLSESGKEEQIAQLEIPDYKKLEEYYWQEKEICLDYTYIDEFEWLGDKAPYEVEGNPYREYEKITARAAIFYSEEPKLIHLMQLKIQSEDLDFSYAGFYNLNLDICDITLVNGNVEFSDAHIIETEILLGGIECSGSRYFTPEVSFRYIKAHKSKILTMLMTQSLSLDFLCAKTEETEVCLDPLPKTFENLCFVKSNISQVKLSNASIKELDIGEARFDCLELRRCEILGKSNLSGSIKRFLFNDCINTNILRIALEDTEEVSFEDAINSGRIYFKDFPKLVEKITEKKNEQLLMLKENFRQLGEYDNEDICHLHYQKAKTKEEKRYYIRGLRRLLDWISGYGTKPCRTFLTIILLILIFGTAYYIIPCLQYQGVSGWLECIYASAITFFAVGYGDLFPATLATKMVSLVEAFSGVTMTSYFLVLLSRKVIR